MMILAFPQIGHAVTTMSIQFGDTLRVISLDMPRREVIETLGTPDIIKSDGKCLQYEFMGLSVFINRNDQVEQIYLSNKFQGAVGGKGRSGGIQLSDIEEEFGAPAMVDRLNYQPSPIIQTKATTETENATDPTGKEMEEFPLQYPGNKKLYVFYNNGEIIKHKYVFDEEGIAFWLDQNMQLYATVLYTSRAKEAPEAVKEAPEAAKKVPAVRLSVIHFDFDKHNIRQINIPDLDQQVAYLTEHPTARVTVEGHTDSKGSVQYNQRLSERRADAVRQYLIEKGIASSRIQVAGYSKLRPVADNETAEGRAMNRRTEFEVTFDK